MSMSVTSFSSSLAIIGLLLGGCASTGEFVADQLDPVTAVTSTRTTKPLVLYRDESALAAHARDYIYIGPVEVNRMGGYTYFLWFGIWSTLQDRNVSAERDGFESVVLFVDGEPLGLELTGWTHSSIGASEPIYPKPVATSADAYYAVTLDQIRLIAGARDIRLQTSDIGAASYEPWDSTESASAGLRAFLDAVAY